MVLLHDILYFGGGGDTGSDISRSGVEAARAYQLTLLKGNGRLTHSWQTRENLSDVCLQDRSL